MERLEAMLGNANEIAAAEKQAPCKLIDQIKAGYNCMADYLRKPEVAAFLNQPVDGNALAVGAIKTAGYAMLIGGVVVAATAAYMGYVDAVGPQTQAGKEMLGYMIQNQDMMLPGPR